MSRRNGLTRLFCFKAEVPMQLSFDRLLELVDKSGGSIVDGVYWFRNRRGDKLKGLFVTGKIVTIWYMRLEKRLVNWPYMRGKYTEIDPATLAVLLQGYDHKDPELLIRASKALAQRT